MSKSRFTTTDVQAMVRDIRGRVMGQRVANVYDLSEKCYLLKFAVPGNSTKVTLLLESGIRFHTTKYSRELPELPSAFAMKLRKYIRTKRLEDVRQIGVDRVVDFKFGSGDAVNHIILELYANGNIVLTDGNYEVLALLRSHQFADDVKLKVGEVYPIAYSTNAAAGAGMGIEGTDSDIQGMTNALASADLSATASGAGHSGGILAMTVEEFKQYAAQKLFEFKEFHAHEELALAAAAQVREFELNQQATHVEPEIPSKMTEKAKKKAAKKVLVAQLAQAAGPKKKKSKEMVLRQLLLCKDSGVASCGPEVLDHCLLLAETKPSLRVEALEGLSEEAVSRMLGELSQAHLLTDRLNTPGLPGYIAYKDPPVSGAKASAGAPAQVPDSTADVQAAPQIDAALEFTEYLPMLLAQHMGKKVLTFPSFDEAVDEYYSKLESQRLEKEAQAAEIAAQKKIEKIRRDQEKMQQGLVAAQERMQSGARLLEACAEEVDKVALVINSALGAGMTWEDIAEMVKAETAAGNPIASLVSRLDLPRNRLWLKLRDTATTVVPEEEEEVVEGGFVKVPAATEEALFDSDSDQEDGNDADSPQTSKAPKDRLKGKRPQKSAAGKVVEVEFDLTLSAHGNARKLYTQKKVAYVKEAKTVEASAKVLQQVGERVLQGVENQKLKRNLRAVRKIHWFEKFNWCISSEGYLILSGRDAQQNEMLFKRYLRPSDIYVHADIPGAATCIVRAKSPAMLAASAAATAHSAAAGGFKHAHGTAAAAAVDRPISPLAIQEAGVMAVSRSNAWKGKIGGVAAWWVWANQVSKTAPSGEYLTTGSFMIHGKKNFLPPMALEMGFGLMFRLDDASVPRHVKDWKDRSYLSDERSMSVFTENLDRYSVNFDELGPGALCLGDSDGGEDSDAAHEALTGEGGDAPEDPAETSLLSAENVGKLPVLSAPLRGSEPPQAAPEDAITKSEEAGRKGKKGKAEKADRKGRAGRKAETPEPEPAPVVVVPEEDEHGSEGEGEGEEEGSVQSASEYSEEDRKPATRQPAPEQGKGKGKGVKAPNAPPPISGKGGKAAQKGNNKGDKGGKGRGKVSDEEPEDVGAAEGTSQAGAAARKKHVNKKKARRYAEQDEEDRELAMLVLGHASAKTGERLGDKQAKQAKEKKSTDLKARQEKAGIAYVTEDSWEHLLGLLPEAVRAVLEGIIGSGFLKAGELDAYEMKSLAAFPSEQGVEILYLFSEGSNLKKAGNKSGFLAGIMRRYSANAASKKADVDKAPLQKPPAASASADAGAPSSSTGVEQSEGDVENDPAEGIEGDAGASEELLSRRARKKQEQDEVRAIMEAEGIDDEEEGKQADEVEKLTGVPLPEDVLLYAVPVCGPYAALQNFKFKVKLTPGAGKKGKVCKQAIELFTRARNCTAAEKGLIGGLTDPEVVAIMIGDARLSMPGLHQLQAEKRVTKKSRGQKKA